MWERSRWGCVFRGSSWPGCSWWSRLHGRESPDSLFLLVGFLFRRIYSTSLKIRSFVSRFFNFTDFGWFEHEQIRRWPRKKGISSRKKGEGKRNLNSQSCSCSKQTLGWSIYFTSTRIAIYLPCKDSKIGGYDPCIGWFCQNREMASTPSDEIG